LLDLSGLPQSASSWKLGPDGLTALAGTRLPSDVWCGVGIYPSREVADAAIEEPATFMPFLAQSLESWHALLLPITHRGECNHLYPSQPGLMFEVAGSDPGGPLIVMTTAGYVMGPDLDMARVIDFRLSVDRIRPHVSAAAGNIAVQRFTPHTYGDDGATLTIWRDDASMAGFAYRAGPHRSQVDRNKAENMTDRTSFTRFRALRTRGQWGGRDPIAIGQFRPSRRQA
jgi:heme-degrading monooxygenase HmoA